MQTQAYTQIKRINFMSAFGKLRMLVATILCLVSSPSSGWEPQKPVSIVVMSSPGGGLDYAARLLSNVIHNNNYSKTSFVPLNKPGRSGVAAMSHVKSLAGDDHTILIGNNNLFTAAARHPRLGLEASQFPHIARMAEQPLALWVHRESGIRSIDQFVSSAKSARSRWVMGEIGAGSKDSSITRHLNSAYGLNMTFLPHRSTKDIAAQIVGKQVDSSIGSISSHNKLYKEGSVLPLAFFARERLYQFLDIPTFGELGVDLVHLSEINVVGSPGMSAEALEYYRNLFGAVHSSDDWRRYLSTNLMERSLLQCTGGECPCSPTNSCSKKCCAK